MSLLLIIIIIHKKNMIVSMPHLKIYSCKNMYKPKKRYTFCYKKNHLKRNIYKYIGEMDQNKIDNLDEQQQAKLAKYIAKFEKEKQLRKAIKIKEKQQKSPQPLKEEITKIETTMKKSYERFNVFIIDNNVPLIQLNKKKKKKKKKTMIFLLLN